MTRGLQRPGEDEATRALAQAEFRRPLVVEAGAGTGKTALLVARVAAWCVGAGWDRHAADDRTPAKTAQRVIEGVVAITFTEAAAAEMASRIGDALINLAHGDEPVGWSPGTVVTELGTDERRARAAAVADEIHRLRVTTIHAFCQRLLAAHPFAAGLHPRFEIDADGDRIEALVDEVVLEALRGLDLSPHRGDWERLAVNGVGPASVAEALRALIAAGATPADLARDPFDPASARTAAADVSAAVDALVDLDGGRLAGLTSVKVAMATMDALAEAKRRLEEAGPDATFDDLVAAVAGVDSKSMARLRKWAKGEFGTKEGNALGGDCDGFARCAARLARRLEGLGRLDPEVFGAARSLLLGLLDEVERRRSARGIVTYTDLLDRTARLLEDHPGLCRAERKRIDQLLVDEFQDTDDVQCRIVRQLALTGPADERPGLFVVGDPKQSIYAWRNADLAAYDGFVDEVKAAGGDRCSLTRNFRSVRPILDEVERVVEPIMREQHGFQPAFEGLEATGERIASPGFDRPPWSAVEHWISRHPDEDGVFPAKKQLSDRATELEAAAIAADVRRLHDEAGVRFGDVAVLLRTTTRQQVILDALRRLDVPFEVAKEREYYRQREIVEIAALIRAVLEPADTLALLAVLRSDPVGVPDAALAPLWDAGLAAAAAALDGRDDRGIERARGVVDRAAAALEIELLPHWPDAVVGGLEVLAELRRSLREDPPDVFVERLRTLWLAEVAAGARSLGRFRRARLDGFFTDLEATLCLGDGGVAELARFLRRAVAEAREAPQETEPDRAVDAVHVMTIYGAKGLDFGHVYLAQTHRSAGGRRSGGTTEIHRVGGVAEIQLFGRPSPGFWAVVERRAAQECAERVRLLYVAMTRAKERLVVSNTWQKTGERVDPLDARTIGDLVGHRGDPELIDRLIERGEARSVDAEPGVSWVIPALMDCTGPDTVASRRRATPVVDPPAVASDAAVVAAARRGAARRMAASWTSAASDAAHRTERRMESAPDEEELPLTAAAPTASVATAVGTAVHRLLELVDLGEDLAAEVAARRSAVIGDAVADLPPDRAAAAVDRFDAIVDRLSGGACLERLTEIAPLVVARELQVFLAPTIDDGTSVISGAVDLVYTDPDDGRLVVADYKTDAVKTEEEIASRVERYRPQLAVYADALERALELERPPHTELWLLQPDRIVRLDA